MLLSPAVGKGLLALFDDWKPPDSAHLLRFDHVRYLPVTRATIHPGSIIRLALVQAEMLGAPESRFGVVPTNGPGAEYKKPSLHTIVSIHEPDLFSSLALVRDVESLPGDRDVGR